MILVIGDSCTDVYHYGYTKRLAPEGPVPVFHISKTVKNGGMAKNVCENIQSLGAECELVTNTCDVTKTRYVDDRHNTFSCVLTLTKEKLKECKICGALIFPSMSLS